MAGITGEVGAAFVGVAEIFQERVNPFFGMKGANRIEPTVLGQMRESHANFDQKLSWVTRARSDSAVVPAQRAPIAIRHHSMKWP